MKRTLTTYRCIFFETVIAACACLCVGLAAYGTTVFSVYSHKFVFISDGITGAFTFYTLRRLRPRDTVALLLVLFLFQALALTRSVVLGRGFMDFIFFAAIPLAVAVFFWSYRKHRNGVKIYDPLILGAFCAVMIAIARGILILQFIAQGRNGYFGPQGLFSEAVESYLIGGGLGIGLWAIDLPAVRGMLHFPKGYTSPVASLSI